MAANHIHSLDSGCRRTGCQRVVVGRPARARGQWCRRALVQRDVGVDRSDVEFDRSAARPRLLALLRPQPRGRSHFGGHAVHGQPLRDRGRFRHRRARTPRFALAAHRCAPPSGGHAAGRCCARHRPVSIRRPVTLVETGHRQSDQCTEPGSAFVHPRSATRDSRARHRSRPLTRACCSPSTSPPCGRPGPGSRDRRRQSARTRRWSTRRSGHGTAERSSFSVDGSCRLPRRARRRRLHRFGAVGPGYRIGGVSLGLHRRSDSSRTHQEAIAES